MCPLCAPDRRSGVSRAEPRLRYSRLTWGNVGAACGNRTHDLRITRTPPRRTHSPTSTDSAPPTTPRALSDLGERPLPCQKSCQTRPSCDVGSDRNTDDLTMLAQTRWMSHIPGHPMQRPCRPVRWPVRQEMSEPARTEAKGTAKARSTPARSPSAAPTGPELLRGSDLSLLATAALTRPGVPAGDKRSRWP